MKFQLERRDIRNDKLTKQRHIQTQTVSLSVPGDEQKDPKSQIPHTHTHVNRKTRKIQSQNKYKEYTLI